MSNTLQILGMAIAILNVSVSLGQSGRKFCIVDSLSRKPLPYATVRFPGKQTGVYADIDGNVLLVLDNRDSIVFSHVGYKQASKVGLELLDDTILLAPMHLQLEEVKVGSYRPVDKLQILGTTKLKNTFWAGSMVAVEFAVRVDLPQNFDLFQVKKVLIPLRKVSVSNPVRLHLYESTDEGWPGAELLWKDVIIEKLTENKEYQIDLAEQTIITRSRRLFVSLEWIGNSAERSRVTGPYASFTTSLPEPMTFTRSINDSAHKWVRFLPGSSKVSRQPNLIAGLHVVPLATR